MSYYIEPVTIYKLIDTKTNLAIATCPLQHEAEYMKKCLEEVERKNEKELLQSAE